jgi:mannose-6-phosphate isomerase-like protein (cupin superfamily)
LKEGKTMHKNMREMEQYDEGQFVVKGVYKGQQSEAVLLFLLPGQEMPPHAHERFEVVLVPHKGRGRMTVDGTKEVDLVPETLYYEPAGRTFRFKNTGDTPLQMLITLIRVEPPASSASAPAGAGAEAERNRTEDHLGPSPL